ncbi:unnamed protein product, partial [Didymodactylos carnosus]
HEENGCSSVLPYEALEKHELECGYQSKYCQGCQGHVLEKDYAQHQDKCAEISLKCSKCDTTYKRKHLKQHTKVQCLQQQLEQQRCQHEQEIKQLRCEL